MFKGKELQQKNDELYKREKQLLITQQKMQNDLSAEKQQFENQKSAWELETKQKLVEQIDQQQQLELAKKKIELETKNLTEQLETLEKTYRTTIELEAEKALVNSQQKFFNVMKTKVEDHLQTLLESNLFEQAQKNAVKEGMFDAILKASDDVRELYLESFKNANSLADKIVDKKVEGALKEDFNCTTTIINNSSEDFCSGHVFRATSRIPKCIKCGVDKR
jgi:2-oxoglutarate dehydrogenase complex dehydrogenase (E1) component-like enzyme